MTTKEPAEEDSESYENKRRNKGRSDPRSVGNRRHDACEWIQTEVKVYRNCDPERVTGIKQQYDKKHKRNRLYYALKSNHSRMFFTFNLLRSDCPSPRSDASFMCLT